jgi:hypothetical protein
MSRPGRFTLALALIVLAALMAPFTLFFFWAGIAAVLGMIILAIVVSLGPRD